VLSYVRQAASTCTAARRHDPAMIRYQLLTSTQRKTPIGIGFLGAVRLGVSKSAVEAGGRAP